MYVYTVSIRMTSHAQDDDELPKIYQTRYLIIAAKWRIYASMK